MTSVLLTKVWYPQSDISGPLVRLRDISLNNVGPVVLNPSDICPGDVRCVVVRLVSDISPFDASHVDISPFVINPGAVSHRDHSFLDNRSSEANHIGSDDIAFDGTRLGDVNLDDLTLVGFDSSF